jgi:hypothetical protein
MRRRALTPRTRRARREKTIDAVYRKVFDADAKRALRRALGAAAFRELLPDLGAVILTAKDRPESARYSTEMHRVHLAGVDFYRKVNACRRAFATVKTDMLRANQHRWLAPHLASWTAPEFLAGLPDWAQSFTAMSTRTLKVARTWAKETARWRHEKRGRARDEVREEIGASTMYILARGWPNERGEWHDQIAISAAKNCACAQVLTVMYRCAGLAVPKNMHREINTLLTHPSLRSLANTLTLQRKPK